MKTMTSQEQEMVGLGLGECPMLAACNLQGVQNTLQGKAGQVQF